VPEVAHMQSESSLDSTLHYANLKLIKKYTFLFSVPLDAIPSRTTRVQIFITDLFKDLFLKLSRKQYVSQIICSFGFGD
jgi:hypothetical protein